MSSIPDQVESESSSQSLLSRRQTEMGSHFVMESGIYMSSFAATIFIAALGIVGVLMISLLVALTVMLDSCQSRNSGVVKQFVTSDEHNYCTVFSFHAEFNNLEADEFPSTCKKHALKYIEGGQFLRDFNLTVQLAESHFSTMKPNNHLDVILMDADDIFLLDTFYSGNSAQPRIKDMKHLASMLILKLHMKFLASGWSLILFTRESTMNKNTTTESLIAAGYGGWTSLIMRSNDDLQKESWEYMAGMRMQLLEQGFRIASVISSQMDAFRGPCLGKRNFKLANPVYYMRARKDDRNEIIKLYG